MILKQNEVNHRYEHWPNFKIDVASSCDSIHNWLEGVLNSSEYKIQLLNNEEAKILSLKEWSPFLEENSVIRENGRLKWTKIPYEWKCHLNIILPAKHVTTVLVREYHSHGHLGPE